MSEAPSGSELTTATVPRLQKPVKRKEERKAQKQKRLLQDQLQRELQLQLQQQQQQHSQKQQNPPRKRGCCYTCCCCCRRGEKKNRESAVEDEVEDDATHIASLSNNSSQPKSSEKSSCCFSCCRKKKKRKSGIPTSDSQTKTAGKNTSCRRCCRSFTAFIFSHIGLCSLVVAYSIMGGFLFNYLESFDELRERVGVTRTRNECVGKLWNMTKELNILYERNWTAMADEILRDFQNSLYFAVKEKGWDGRDESNEEMQWSFSGSLLYSVTVITTIGYGHIAPKTEMGRLVTMLYALIGIPLTLLCISNIGSFFANCFRFLYKNICVCLERLCCSTRQRKARYSGSTSTMTTTASLKSVASRKSKSIKDINAEYEESRQALRKDNQDISVVEKGLQTAPRTGRESGKGCKHAGDDGEVNLLVVDDNSGRKSSNKEKVRVPMSVSLLIIFLYIFGGAVLFSCWEQDWSYLIGSYFCFITLSTIGFGDYVFGVGNDLDNSQKMITCALYLVLGLSIIAMCFELMQEEVRAKCRWLGAKLGIIESSKKTRKK